MNQIGMNDDSVNDGLRARMSEADAARWDEIQRWKAAQLSYKRPRVITEKMKSAALAPVGKAVSIARKVPGGEALTRTVSSAALGLVELAASASEASVRRKRILKAYRSAGFDVRTLQDIRSLTLDDVLASKPEAVMMLRVQRERMSGAGGGFFPSPEEYSRQYGLNAERLSVLGDDAVLMHPGPMNRGLEISADAADSGHSVVLEQVANGVSVRMAALYLLLAHGEEISA